MIRVIVDDDVIVGPIPAIYISHIKGSDTEVVPTEPETTRTASPNPPHETRPEAAFEVAVLPGMVQMESGVVPPLIVSHPFTILVDVRGLGMSFLIAEGRVISRWAGRILNRPAEIVVGSGRAATRNITAADRMTGSFSVISASSAVAFMLGKEGYGRHEQNCNQ